MRVERISVAAYRVPVARPVATSFGVMRDRPAVFVRLEGADGAFGWGEIFANWPAAGAEHRVRLLAFDIAPLVVGVEMEGPGDLWAQLDRAVAVRAIQCGEPGPFAHVLAGLDTAMHDMAARARGVPLAEALAPGAPGDVAVYASGIEVGRGVEAIPAARATGIAAFKLKIGFDAARDLAALRAAAATLGPGERLFVDANQAWGLDAALAFVEAARDLPLGWLEEPIRVDAPAADWARLAGAGGPPLAGGENIAGAGAFAAAIAAGHLGVLQPDVAKWGGVSGCLAVARQALAAGRRFCPHFLGGGIGLLASGHLLAAAGGDGLLELDANANPLRDAFVGDGALAGGRLHLGAAPGLGIETLPDAIAPYRTLALDIDGEGRICDRA